MKLRPVTHKNAACHAYESTELKEGPSDLTTERPPSLDHTHIALVCAHMYIHTCIGMCTCACIHKYSHMCTYTYIHSSASKLPTASHCTPPHTTGVRIYADVYTHVRTCKPAEVHVRIFTVHMYVYIHVYASQPMSIALLLRILLVFFGTHVRCISMA